MSSNPLGLGSRHSISYILSNMRVRRIIFIVAPILFVAAAALIYVKLFSNNASTCTVDATGTEKHCSEMVFSNGTTTPQRFIFKELGISLDVVPGWNVERQTVGSPKSNQITEYIWIIQKKDGDGKLVLDSIQYASNVASACLPADMSPAEVTSVSETENPALKYVTYRANINNKDIHAPLIVRSDEKSFYKSESNPDAVTIVSPGNYYVCTKGFALPGSNLRLGDFPKPFTGEWRQSISALQQSSNSTNWLPLPADSPLLPDISTMLKSIK
jgi:hypothetical protein